MSTIYLLVPELESRQTDFPYTRLVKYNIVSLKGVIGSDSVIHSELIQ